LPIENHKSPDFLFNKLKVRSADVVVTGIVAKINAVYYVMTENESVECCEDSSNGLNKCSISSHMYNKNNRLYGLIIANFIYIYLYIY
jgi:hypothetical protein